MFLKGKLETAHVARSSPLKGGSYHARDHRTAVRRGVDPHARVHRGARVHAPAGLARAWLARPTTRPVHHRAALSDRPPAPHPLAPPRRGGALMLRVMVGGPLAVAMGFTLTGMAYGYCQGVKIPMHAVAAALTMFVLSGVVACHAIIKDIDS